MSFNFKRAGDTPILDSYLLLQDHSLLGTEAAS